MTSWAYTVVPPVSALKGANAGAVPLESVVPTDFALDESGDLALREGANGALEIYLVEGVDAIVQRLRILLRFWLGAWFLDTSEGIPYLEQILVKNPDVRLIQLLFRRVILQCPGIARVDKLDPVYDPAGRRLALEGLEISLLDGSKVTFDASPFIVLER